MKTLLFILSVVVGNVLGLLIAWLDSRPHWDDAGISAFLLLIAAFVCGLLGRRYVWIVALSVGVWIPLSGIISSSNFGSLIALIPAFIGAYLGFYVGKLAFRAVKK